MEIGQILKEARETNQLSLDDLQEITKIQKRYLVAIEQDDFHALPGRFYARAFIKEYAHAVGLDANELLQYFDEGETQPQEETVQYTRLERSKRSRSSKSSTIFSLLPSIIVVILVIGIIVVAWTLYQKSLPTNDPNISDQESDEIIRNVDEPVEKEQNDSSHEEEDQEQAQEDPLGNGGEFTVIEVGTGNSPLSTLDFTYHDQVIVDLEITATTYVALSGASGQTYFDGTVEPGTEIEQFDVSSEESIYFNIGNTPGLTIKLNDIQLEYPVPANERVHQKLSINLKKTR